MKATRSVDGEMRFTVTTKYRVGREEIISRLIYHGGKPEDWPKSKAQLKAWIADNLHFYGVAYPMPHDDYEPDEMARVEKEARMLVSRLFPELWKGD